MSHGSQRFFGYFISSAPIVSPVINYILIISLFYGAESHSNFRVPSPINFLVALFEVPDPDVESNCFPNMWEAHTACLRQKQFWPRFSFFTQSFPMKILAGAWVSIPGGGVNPLDGGGGWWSEVVRTDLEYSTEPTKLSWRTGKWHHSRMMSVFASCWVPQCLYLIWFPLSSSFFSGFCLSISEFLHLAPALPSTRKVRAWLVFPEASCSACAQIPSLPWPASTYHCVIPSLPLWSSFFCLSMMN